MDDIFHKAFAIVSRERRLRGELVRPLDDSAARLRVLPGSPDNQQDLAILNSGWDPSVLPPKTKLRLLKRLILRALKPFSFGQIWFNAAVCRIVSSREEWLQRLPTGIDDALNGVMERVQMLESDLGELTAGMGRPSGRDMKRAVADLGQVPTGARLDSAERALVEVQRILNDLRRELEASRPAGDAVVSADRRT